MEITALCTIMATLSIFPNRSQFFRYESVTLSCGELKNSNWTIKRNTSTKTNEECSKHWGTKNESNCFLQDAYPSDSGLYWCDSGAGACSEAVNITVTGGSVILESPVHPLQEGDAATLRCMVKQTSFISLPAEFYKDGHLIRNSSTGIMTILKVSKSDEGFYKCTISGSGESPDSWLSVKGTTKVKLTLMFPTLMSPSYRKCSQRVTKKQILKQLSIQQSNQQPAERRHQSLCCDLFLFRLHV
ncbi:high affinity immunoglobulin gamma Fc receptor I-like isoform X5 [Simochromis diagramma]|uniref:high affinity immunoglobulin gamma Fc receptor I-like isoform X5 n=1 Tax=Simochromis diagramma TaxID=43689 RepID=UPI001A7E5815|nr:high affinity immunoglobulin gamma Fc receptor I-like isoform X5 [Simochromis diagramma]